VAIPDTSPDLDPTSERISAPIPAPGALPPPVGLQIWWAQVDVGRLDDQARAVLAADLDPATRTRVGRFVRAQDRDRGLAAHSLLRRLLAAVAGGAPSEIVLRTRCAACGTDAHGKPYLDRPGRSPVEVNLSHSAQAVCVALAPAGIQVGVDVEQRRQVDWSSLRRSVFGDEEWAATQDAPDPERRRLDAWSRKESSVKASGHGLALPLKGVHARDAEWGGWTAVLPQAAGFTAGWDLALHPGLAAAVAVHDLDRPAPPEPPIVRFVTVG